jgi:protein-tyrosine phosphatase
MTISVLMICLGNICRSPMAEGALRAHGEALGLALQVDSAGTGDWHVGAAPDKRAHRAALAEGGVDISDPRGRQVRASDFHDFDYVLAMDHTNLADLRALMPEGAAAKLALLLDFLPGHEGQGVADPYYGEAQDFAKCWHLVDKATLAFAKTVR